MNLLDLIFGCSHENTTWPQTVKRDRKWPPELRTYIVCLGCGKEFPYSWAEMRIVQEVKEKERLNGRNYAFEMAGRLATDALSGSPVQERMEKILR